jgi:1,4-alpha-glucan branching enzyme
MNDESEWVTIERMKYGRADERMQAWLRPEGAGALVWGDSNDPFSILGPHPAPEATLRIVRTFQPYADSVSVVAASGHADPQPLTRVDDAGLFAGIVAADTIASGYRLNITRQGMASEIEDPYRFGPILGDLDIYLLAEGRHYRAYDVLGGHVTEREGVAGVAFAVWAPNAARVGVVGDFNRWDGRCHPMRLRHGCGVWELFVPGLKAGTLYKYEIKTKSGDIRLKADPYGFAMERPPATASRITPPSGFTWSDDAWMQQRRSGDTRNRPMAIYEVHLGSWRRNGGIYGRWLSYRELADELVGYVRDMDFTHIELLPISEYPFDGSWGYQPSGLYAPTSRFGNPDDLRYFINACHDAGIGVFLDWVPGHFPNDDHGLARFDGTYLYEHEDERKGMHREWGTLIYNYGRPEVANFLIANALYWLREFHIDGLRVDAVASMLYLDYSRKPGEWEPNVFGGNENLEAIAFMRRLNETVYGEIPDVMMMAEESTSWPMVSQPTSIGGLGFGYKWNMGWMNDTLRYMRRDPAHRSYHHDELTFGMLYAYSENFILPLSHDEVVHGKGSLLGKMPGDGWQMFANLRLCLSFLYGYPGKKLLFMGCEFGQYAEWNHDHALDWGTLGNAMHEGVRLLTGDLNRLYRGVPALYERDCEPSGFRWIDCQDKDQNVIAFIRQSSGSDFAVIVCNFSPTVLHGYRIGVPVPGYYRECLNTDASDYGGSGVGNSGGLNSEATPWHGFDHSLPMIVPPLATAMFLSPGSPDPRP